MTEAALPVTQSRVEKFTRTYLEAIGGTIERSDDRWDISIPADADTDLPYDEFTLYLGEYDGDLYEREEILHPESEFFQRILEEASDRGKCGKLSIDADDIDVILPEWIENGPLEISEAEFVPYYDRTAVVILYEVSIETVSEFEQVVLEATAIDLRLEESLPNLAETFLDFTDREYDNREVDSIEFDDSELSGLIQHGSKNVAESIHWKIDDIHREASQAADQELEEFRQMQEQRIKELTDRRERLADRLDELNNEIEDQTGEVNRVELLQERKQIRSEYDQTIAELDQLQKKRERGFPSKQREIRERHDVEVVIRPRTVTEISYEQGEIELRIEDDSDAEQMRLGYGTGIGVTEDVLCDVCGEVLTENRPLGSVAKGIKCRRCL